MTRNERAHAYLLALIAGASAFKWKDVDDMVLIAFDLADAFEAKATETSTPLPEIDVTQADVGGDGWVENDGAQMFPPIPDGIEFLIQHRNGCVYKANGLASTYAWDHHGDQRDIMRHKVLA